MVATLDLPVPTVGLLLHFVVWLLLQVVVMEIIAPLNVQVVLLRSQADPQLGSRHVSNREMRREREQITLGSSIASLPKKLPSHGFFS
jgi:hypothetical protein